MASESLDVEVGEMVICGPDWEYERGEHVEARVVDQTEEEAGEPAAAAAVVSALKPTLYIGTTVDGYPVEFVLRQFDPDGGGRSQAGSRRGSGQQEGVGKAQRKVALSDECIFSISFYPIALILI